MGLSLRIRYSTLGQTQTDNNSVGVLEHSGGWGAWG